MSTVEYTATTQVPPRDCRGKKIHVGDRVVWWSGGSYPYPGWGKVTAIMEGSGGRTWRDLQPEHRFHASIDVEKSAGYGNAAKTTKCVYFLTVVDR